MRLVALSIAMLAAAIIVAAFILQHGSAAPSGPPACTSGYGC